MRNLISQVAAVAAIAALTACASQETVTDMPAETITTTTTSPTVEPNVPTSQTHAYDFDKGGKYQTEGATTYEVYTESSGSAIDGIMSAVNFEENPALYSGTIDTRTIYFGYDEDYVPRAAYETLKAHARYLNENPSLTVSLEGHADERGTRDYNVALSERRAKAVKRMLVLNGADSKQINVVAYGEEMPAVTGTDELSWAKNRRVEINY